MIPLPTANFVNYPANRLGINFKESPKRVHSPSLSTSQPVAFSPFSRSISRPIGHSALLLIPLPPTTVVNSRANQASMGFEGSPKQVYSPSPSTVQSAAFPLSAHVCVYIYIKSSTRASIGIEEYMRIYAHTRLWDLRDVLVSGLCGVAVLDSGIYRPSPHLGGDVCTLRMHRTGVGAALFFFLAEYRPPHGPAEL